jgi:hypothetical protein
MSDMGLIIRELLASAYNVLSDDSRSFLSRAVGNLLQYVIDLDH